MLKNLKVYAALIIAASFVTTANAGVLIEPYLGYLSGSETQGPVKTDFSGVYYGGRLGYKHMLGLMGGFDYMTGKLTDKATPANDITPSQLGIFVGFEFPILLRVYGVYGISNKLELKNSSGTSTLEGPSNIKLGVGFTALPLLSINVEYMMGTYDKTGGNKFTPEITSKAFGLSVSVPFNL